MNVVCLLKKIPEHKKVVFLTGSFAISLAAFFEWPDTKTMSAHDYLRAMTYVIAAWGAIASSVISTWNSLDSVKKEEATIDFKKIENSFYFVAKWETPLLKGARRYTRTIRDEREKISDEALVNKIKSDQDLRESLICTFNFWEELYVSIEYKRVVEPILKEAFSEIFCDMYTRFRPWRDSEMKIHNNNGYKNINLLYEHWHSANQCR